MSEKETHKRYTIEFKLAVVDWIKHHKSSFRAAAKQFGVDRKMIREWTTNKNTYEVAMTKHGPQRCRVQGGRPPLSSELDLVVLEYLKRERSKGNKVSDKNLQDNAIEASKLLNIPHFKGTQQWLRRWKKRNNVVVRDGSNMHEPVSYTRQEESRFGKSKGDSLLSHIEPKEQVKLEKKTSRKRAKSISQESKASSDGRTDEDLLTGGKNGPSTSSLNALNNAGSSSEEEEPRASTKVMFDFSTPEHSYCQSDCLVEEEMISQFPALGELEGNDILQLITADGVVEKITSQEEDGILRGGQRSKEDTSSLLLSDEEGLYLGQEVVVSSCGTDDIASIVKSFRSSRMQHEMNDSQLVKNGHHHSAATCSSTSSSHRLSEHSYSQPRYPFGDYYDHSARTMGSMQRYTNNAHSFTNSMQSYTSNDHDYEFTSLGRLSPQLPAFPLLPSLPSTFGQHSSFLQEISDFPPTITDPMNIISSPCSGLFGSDRNLYSSNSGTVAPIVYVDRPTSPPCAVSSQYR